MAESVSGGSSSGQPPKEMSMEIRLLLAFLLMGAVMFVTPYFLKTPEPPAVKKAPASPAAASTTTTPPAAPAAASPAPETDETATAAAVPGATKEQPASPLVIDTSLFRIQFSNQGATVRSWQLKKFHGNDGKWLELMNTASGLEYPFSLYFPGAQPTAKVNWTYYTQTADPDGLGVSYAFSDGHTSVHRVTL